MSIENEAFTTILLAVGTVVGTAVGLALSALALRYAAQWYKELAIIIRTHVDSAIVYVDEPDDAVNEQLDQLLDRLRPYTWNVLAARVLPVVLRAVADVFENEQQPEHREQDELSEAVK